MLFWGTLICLLLGSDKCCKLNRHCVAHSSIVFLLFFWLFNTLTWFPFILCHDRKKKESVITANIRKQLLTILLWWLVTKIGLSSVKRLGSISLWEHPVFSALASSFTHREKLSKIGGREATTGNTSAVRRLGFRMINKNCSVIPVLILKLGLKISNIKFWFGVSVCKTA